MSFSVGDKVTDVIYGEGTVLAVDGSIFSTGIDGGTTSEKLPVAVLFDSHDIPRTLFSFSADGDPIYYSALFTLDGRDAWQVARI